MASFYGLSETLTNILGVISKGQATKANSLPVVLPSDQTVAVDGSGVTQPVSGTVAVSNLPATQPISAGSLPLPAGASTAAKQPALGTAGSASADVISVQGVAGGVAQPMSAASLPLPAGAATESTLGTLAQEGAPITGQSLEAGGTHVLGWLASLRKAITDRLPSALTGSGNLKVALVESTATQAISVATLPLPTGAAADATLTGGTAKAIARGGAKGVTSAADLTGTAEGADHQALDVQLYHGGTAKDPTAIRALTSADVVSLGAGSAVVGHVINDASSAVIGHVIADTGSTTAVTGNVATTNAAASQADGHSSTFGATTDAAVTTDVTGSISARLRGLVNLIAARLPAALGAGGGLKVDGSGTALPVSGTVTGNQGTAAASSGAWPIKVTDTSDAPVRPGDATNNAIRVNIVAGAGSGGTAQADKSAFTEGTTSATPISGVFNETIAADPTEDQAAAVRITAKRALHVHLRDGQGDSAMDDANNALRVNVVAGGGAGGTSSGFGSADPATGTAAGYSDGTNMREARVFDADSGAGTQFLLGALLKKPASGGSVDFGTSSDPVRTDPTGTTTQPVSGTVTANAGTNLNTSALALDATLGTTNTEIGGLTEIAPATDTASSGLNGRLQRVAQRLTTMIAQLPASLGQKAMAASLPVVIASDQSAVPISAASLPLPTGAATSAKQPALGTAGSASADVLSVQGVASMIALKVDGSGVTQPISGSVTANVGTTNGLALDATLTGRTQKAQLTDGTRDVATLFDADTGAGTQYIQGVSLRKGASGGSVEAATSTDPLRVDPTGTTTQPVSAAALPLPSGASTSAKQPALGTAGSASADVISVQGVASMTALKVDGSAVIQPVSAASLPLPTGAAADATLTGGTAKARITDGTNTAAVKAASTAAAATDPALVVALSPNSPIPAGTAIIGALSLHQSTNVDQLAGTTPDTNSGLKSAGTLRVVLATDQPQLTNKLLVTPDANSAINVAQVGGAAVGTAASGVQKVGVVGNAGATVDSPVGAGTAPTNAVAAAALFNPVAPAPTTGQAMALQADQAGNLRTMSGVALAALAAWNSGTALNATQTIFTNSGADSVLVHLVQTTTLTAGAITFELSYDGNTWVAIPAQCVLDPASTSFAQLAVPYTVQASTNKPFLIALNGAQALRIKLSTQITGTGSVTPNYALLNYGVVDTVIALSPTAANFNVNSNLQTGSNTVGNVGAVTITSGGASMYEAVAAGSNNAASIKASAGKVMGWYIFNAAAATRYVKLYNVSGTPAPATDTVKWVIAVPAGGAANMAFGEGLDFPTGIGIAMVTGIGNTDNTAVTANDLVVSIAYK